MLEFKDNHTLIRVVKYKYGYEIEIFTHTYSVEIDKDYYHDGSSYLKADVVREFDLRYSPDYDFPATIDNFKRCLSKLWITAEEEEKYLQDFIKYLEESK